MFVIYFVFFLIVLLLSSGLIYKTSYWNTNEGAPLVADLFIFCYESEFMKNLSKSNDLNLIKKFNNTYRYLDDLCWFMFTRQYFISN